MLRFYKSNHTLLEMSLRKIELVYVNPESMLNSSNVIASQCFPSKKTHIVSSF